MKYHYRAKQGPLDHLEGELEAANERAAIDAILAQGLTPLTVKAVSASKRTARVEPGFKGAVDQLLTLRTKVFQVDVVLFFRYMADFLNAGVPVLQSLELTKRYFKSGRMSYALEQVELAVRDGDSLSDALRKAPAIFLEMYAHIVHAGEVSGSLESTLGQFADFLERDYENRVKVVSSLIYPSIILLVGFATIFILLTWVIPRVVVIFEDMDQAIPLITQILIAVSTFFAHFWWLMVIVVGLGCGILGRWYQTDEGHRVIDQRIFALPLLGSFMRETAVARFARTLGAMLNGGVEVVPALRYASKVVGNRYIQEQLEGIADVVAGGEPLSQALRQGSVFLEEDTSMLAVGEETGTIASGLFKLASFYEKRNDRTIKTMTTMIEPALILGLGLVIGFVVLAMLMPIFQMNLAVR